MFKNSQTYGMGQKLNNFSQSFTSKEKAKQRIMMKQCKQESMSKHHLILKSSGGGRGGQKILQNLIIGGNKQGINKGLEDSSKSNSWVGVDEILFDMLKSNTKKLKCFGLLSLFSKKQIFESNAFFQALILSRNI